jgi:threonyl-tRNA synthetase
MREANKFNAKYVVFVGGDEFNRGELNVKNLSNGEQQLIKIEDFEKLKSLLKVNGFKETKRCSANSKVTGKIYR